METIHPFFNLSLDSRSHSSLVDPGQAASKSRNINVQI